MANLPEPAAVALSLGANLGDRLASLRGAIALFDATAGCEIVAVSDVYETEPVGGPDQPDYLNAVMLIRAILAPEAVLAVAQAAEGRAGRVRELRWGPRTLDVDVLNYGASVRSDVELTLPHPRVLEREFVLRPWAQIDPATVIAGTGITVADALDRLLTAEPPASRVGSVSRTGVGGAVRARPDLALRPRHGHTLSP